MVERERNRVLPGLGDQIRDGLLPGSQATSAEVRDSHPDGQAVRLLMRERRPTVGCSWTEPRHDHASGLESATLRGAFASTRDVYVKSR